MYLSHYPPEQNNTYVKATTEYDITNPAYNATNPALSLINSSNGTQWWAEAGINTNQRFHIDLGSAKIITRIYYENSHESGSMTNSGAKNFTFWGSNDINSFNELTYATDTGWTQLTTEQTVFEQHADLNLPDPKYILVTNAITYRYYAIKIEDNYGNADMAIRRIELQEFFNEGIQNISNKFETLKDNRTFSIINNEFRTNKLDRQDINNEFRMIASWQEPGEAGIEALGKSYIAIKINGVDITTTSHVDIDSINWQEVLNDSSEADFKLALPYDSPSKPYLGQTVEILFNTKRKFYGYITTISKLDNPEGISVHAKGEFYKFNEEMVTFSIGRQEKGSPEGTYYPTYKEALSILEFNVDIGNFVPTTENYQDTNQGEVISTILNNCGIFNWYINPDGTKKLWEGGKGNIIYLENQEIGKNLDIYQLINHTLKEDDSERIGKLKVIMGDSVKKGYDNTFFFVGLFNGFQKKYEDDPVIYTKEYIETLRWVEGPRPTNVESYIANIDGWTYTIPGDYNPPYYSGGAAIRKWILNQELIMGVADENIRHVFCSHCTYVYGGLYPEGIQSHIFYIGSGDKERILSLSNLNTQYGAIYKFHGGGSIENWSGQETLEPEETIWVSWGFTPQTIIIPSWDDTAYATDIANLEYYKYKDIKISGSITITLDCADFYGLELNKRIYIDGITEGPLNIKSISYDMSNYLVTINVESFNYYKRTVSYPVHE